MHELGHSSPGLYKLDEVVLSALAPAARVARHDEDRLVALELVAQDEVDEYAVTNRFVRSSVRHERSASFRKAYGARATATQLAHSISQPLHMAWFDKTDGALSKIEDPESVVRARPWWLLISLAVGAVAVLAMALAFG